MLGFAKSFNANKYCRFCDMRKEEMQTCTIEDPSTRRNKQNYTEGVMQHNLSETGIREFSAFNYIPYFHVSESSSEDCTHSVEEGIIKYNVAPALLLLIEDNVFTLEQLNDRIVNFSYGEDEKANKPHPISLQNLREDKLRMTASETATFIHN